MNKETINYLGKQLEVIVDDNGKILFAKETKPISRDQMGNIKMNRVSGYGLLTSFDDVEFVPGLSEKDISEWGVEIGDYENIVDYQYIDAEPSKRFSDARIGNVVIKVFDGKGELFLSHNNIIFALSFQGADKKILVSHGFRVNYDKEGIKMSAPEALKEVVGKNLSEIKEIAIGKHK